MKYSIGIVTYIKRYEKYFQPLIRQIKHFRPNIEIIVCVNGEYRSSFDNTYRSNVLRFMSNYENIFPTCYPNFRSLSKLWNTILINSSNNRVLLLNDDVGINTHIFFDGLEKIISNENQRSFKINGSWSHAFLTREEVSSVGWFDERYLGVGEEDGDFEWRWGKKFGSNFQSVYVPGVHNYVEQNDCLEDIKKVNNKYSKFNHEFAFSEKYQESDSGEEYGIMGKKFVCKSETPPLHLAEEFYWKNRHKL